MQPKDSHQKVSWTVVILLYSQINIDSADVVVNNGNLGKSEPNQKAQTQEFRRLIANLPFQKEDPVFVIYNQVNPLDFGRQNDYTELSQLNIDKKDFVTIKKYETPGVFQEPDKLSSVLRDLRPLLPSSGNLLLMTWDHGAVYGMFKKFKVPRGTQQSDAAEKATYVDMLTPDELAQSITQGLRRKVDLLILMNCWMQNCHTLHGLSDVANYMVASEGLITSFVYDYSIFNRLANRASLDVAKDITQNLLKEYTYKYASTFHLDNQVDTCSIFTTVYGEDFTRFMQSLKKFIDYLLDLLKTNAQAGLIARFILDSRNSVFCWDKGENGSFNYWMVDFLALLIHFSNAIVADARFAGDTAVQHLKDKVMELNSLQAIVMPDPTIGAHPYEVVGPPIPRNYVGRPSGTGIFFPPDQPAMDNSFYSKELKKNNQIGFYTTANPNWLVLLKRYYQLLKS